MANEESEVNQRRIARGEDYWLPLVDAYKSGGMALGDFCESRGIIAGTFKNWIYKSGKSSRQGAAAKEGFVEVKLPRAGAEYRLVVSGNRELVLKDGYDIRRVKELVKVLEGFDV